MMKKLNLSSGQYYNEGFINVDFHNIIKVDAVYNLNQTQYTFETESIDYSICFSYFRTPERPIYDNERVA